MVGLLRDPHAIQNIYRIEDGILGIDATRLMSERLLRDPDIAALARERYLRGQAPDIDALRALPEGSFGREFARFIDDHGLDPAYYQPLPVENDLTYLLARVRETHDIWHVVLGFHPTPIGELGVKAFELAQLHRPMAAIIVAGGLLRHVFVDAHLMDDTLKAMRAGVEAALRARPFLAQRWEEHWDEPLDDLRTRLRVEPVPDDCSGRTDPRGVKASHRAGAQRASHDQRSGVTRSGAATGRDAEGRPDRPARPSHAARHETPERPRRSRR